MEVVGQGFAFGYFLLCDLMLTQKLLHYLFVLVSGFSVPAKIRQEVLGFVEVTLTERTHADLR